MSTKKDLTALAIENFVATSSTQWVKDRGGLYLIVYPARTLRGKNVPASKAFAIRYTPRGGKRRLVMLGDFPHTGLAEARKQAALYEADAKKGIDRKAVLVREAESAAVEVRMEQSRVTVRGLFDRWQKQELNTQRKDGGAEVLRSFEKDVFPMLGTFHANEIRRGQLLEALDKIVSRGSRRMANRTFTDLRQMFQFALDRELIENDPTAGLSKKKVGGKEIERERVLSDIEIRELANALPKAKLARTTEAAIWIMFATLARVSELSMAKWEDVDLDAGVWRIPPENTKTKREHTVFLSAFAVAHFQTLKTEANFAPWVLPAANTELHVGTKTIQKQIRDRQRESALSNRTMALGTLRLSGGPWTAHDLRRSGATLMGELGVRPDVIERCLNHVEQSKMARIYQRQELKSEREDASNKLGQRLALICHKDAANVIPMKRKRKTAA